VTLLVLHGRCRSGRRWFWTALAVADPGQARHECDEPLCIKGGLHDYGWADTEPAALDAMRSAVIELGGPRNAGPGAFGYYATVARDALRRLNAAGWPDLAQLRQAMVSAHPGAFDEQRSAAAGLYGVAGDRCPQVSVNRC